MKRWWGCGVIRVICVIRLIRDSDTVGLRTDRLTLLFDCRRLLFTCVHFYPIPGT